MFAEQEIAYFDSQPLARLATVSSSDQPDNAAVAFEYDGTYFYIGGMNPSKTRKFKNVRDGNSKISLLIDDLESVKPWKPRGIRISGRADLVQRQGQFGSAEYLRIRPTVSWSWNIVGPSMIEGHFVPHKIFHRD